MQITKPFITIKESEIKVKNDLENALKKYEALVLSDNRNLEEKYREYSKALEEVERSSQEVLSNAVKAREESKNALSRVQQKVYNESVATLGPKTLTKKETEFKNVTAEYFTMLQTVKDAVDKMEPAMKPLRDVSFRLKNNLNEETINNLKQNDTQVSQSVTSAVDGFSESILQIDQYIKRLEN